MTTFRVLLSAVLVLFAINAHAAGPAEIVPKSLLVLGSTGSGGRGIVSADALGARLVAGTWKAPSAGVKVRAPDGRERTWESIAPNAEGWFEHRSLNGGWAWLSVDSPESRVILLEASGHSMVYVNGEPRAGDVYGYGYVRLPVRLRPGANGFLFKAGRGRLRVRLVEAERPVFLETTDATLPDLRVSEATNTRGAVVVVNATERDVEGLTIEAQIAGGQREMYPVPRVQALSVRKVAFPLKGQPPLQPGKTTAAIRLLQGTQPLHEVSVELRVRDRHESYRRTFVSGIDGSVQYFAVMPARASDPARRPALVLSLHGASVEAQGNVDAYAAKSWATIVSPTNRRPYGYDWEDWGRLDALEVLDQAREEILPDPDRIYLTGHSMGGHGTWQIGALHPDLFAAIAPSAGWISAATYGLNGEKDRETTPIESILRRAGAAGETRNLIRNYEGLGVYVLHGDADDNVPVTESRTMVGLLKGFHKDLVYHEQPGAGHWWESSDEPGAECMDWPPMFDFLSRRSLPRKEGLRDVSFHTVNPGISARRGYATIETQGKPLELSSIQMRCDPHARRFTGTTVNVERLTLSLEPLLSDGPVTLEIDGSKVEVPRPAGTSEIHLRRTAGRWSVAADRIPDEKGPARNGPFREAFRHRMVFVVGTQGTPEENAWAAAQARYDAETWWYRGNGSVDVVPDTAFTPSAEQDRGVILYGNADTNGAWAGLLGDSPVQVRRGEVRVGNRTWKGEDLSCLFLRPRPGSAVASVAVVSGSGPAGQRLTVRLPYLQPMIGFPDVLVVGADAMETGGKGIRCAGFFGNDWNVASGHFAYADQE